MTHSHIPIQSHACPPTDEEEFDLITLQKQQAQTQFSKLQRQTSASSLDFNLLNLSDIPIFAAADLEQANDVNLTKESEEIEREEELRERHSGTNDETVEELNRETESTDGPKMRVRKAMKEKYSNLE